METPGPTSRQIYKVAVASIIGSVIEQSDFLPVTPRIMDRIPTIGRAW
jgi:hypothetical protein